VADGALQDRPGADREVHLEPSHLEQHVAARRSRGVGAQAHARHAVPSSGGTGLHAAQLVVGPQVVLDELEVGHEAVLLARGTARRERAAALPGQRVGGRAGDRGQLPAADGVQARDRAQQSGGVLVARGAEQLPATGPLDDPAGVHDVDLVAQPGDDPQVVRDHHHGGAAVVHQLLEQLEHLRLDRHVERGRRLVGDEQPGLQASAIAMSARWRMPPDSWWG
jgi:hypothetical protein